MLELIHDSLPEAGARVRPCRSRKGRASTKRDAKSLFSSEPSGFVTLDRARRRPAIEQARPGFANVEPRILAYHACFPTRGICDAKFTANRRWAGFRAGRLQFRDAAESRRGHERATAESRAAGRRTGRLACL